MDAVEAKRNLEQLAQEDGKRERAPAQGVKLSDKPMEPADLGRKRERAPANGVMDSDIPTQLSASTRGGGNEDTLGSGEGKREQAPASQSEGLGRPPRVFR